MDDGFQKRICSIKKENNNWNLYDYEDKLLRRPSANTYFPSSLNMRYRIKRKEFFEDEDTSCVWILIGKKNSITKWIQVGRTKNLKNLLSNDIKEDIKEFYSGNGKYGQLQDKYTELIFFEIDILKYIRVDKVAHTILGKAPINKYLRQAYFVNCAAYIEGKLAFQNKPELYSPATLDSCYFNYFKSKQ